jgi:hypothetical protein
MVVRVLPFWCLQPGRTPSGLFDRSADVHDAGGFELDVVGLEGNELTPAQTGPMGEPHGHRPASVAELGHGVEQRRALLIGGQR